MNVRLAIGELDEISASSAAAAAAGRAKVGLSETPECQRG